MKLDARFRLASGRQLWRASWLGRLRLVDEEGEPLSAEELKAAIADDLAARNLVRYPGAGEPVPERRWAPGEAPSTIAAESELE